MEAASPSRSPDGVVAKVLATTQGIQEALKPLGDRELRAPEVLVRRGGNAGREISRFAADIQREVGFRDVRQSRECIAKLEESGVVCLEPREDAVVVKLSAESIPQSIAQAVMAPD